jgi:hypothetical protein
MRKEVSWSKLFEHRDKIHQRYPEIWDLKLLRKRFPYLLRVYVMAPLHRYLGIDFAKSILVVAEKKMEGKG